MTFDEVFKRYRSDVFSYVSRHVRQRVDAEDITQAVFLKFWQLGEAPPESVRAYLFQIAATQVRNFHRDVTRKKRHAEREPNFDLHSLQDREPTPESKLEQKEFWGGLDRVLVMRHRDALSERAVARTLNTTREKVRAVEQCAYESLLLRYGRHALRDLLAALAA